MQTLVRRMPVSESVVEAILKLVRSARPDADNDHAKKHIAWGPRPPRQPGIDALRTRSRAL
jgi:MoxR-like ATPase